MYLPEKLQVKQPALFLADCAYFPDTPSLRAQFTLKDKFEQDVKAYVEKPNGLLGVPLNCAVGGALEDRRTLGGEVGRFYMTMEPRDDEQARCIEESFNLLRNGVNHCIRAGTGRGKSYMGCAIASRLNLPTLIIVNKDDLMTQWRKEALLKFTDLKPEDIGRIQADVCDWKGKKVVLAMIHSLALDKYGDELKDYFGLVIWDECHRVAADTFFKTAMMFNGLLRLGLSANKVRSDGLMYLVFAVIGPQMVVTEIMPVTPKVLVKKSNFKIPTVVRRVQGVAKRVPIEHSPGKMGAVYKVMANDGERNNMILDMAESCFNKNRNTVIFSDTRDHLDTLAALLQSARKLPKEAIGYYVGGMKPAALKEGAHRPIVMATYAMCAEATDFPHWDACIFATPRSAINQAVGRILREKAGKPKPVVFDIRDKSSDILEGYWFSRLKYYHSLKSEIVELS